MRVLPVLAALLVLVLTGSVGPAAQPPGPTSTPATHLGPGATEMRVLADGTILAWDAQPLAAGHAGAKGPALHDEPMPTGSVDTYDPVPHAYVAALANRMSAPQAFTVEDSAK